MEIDATKICQRDYESFTDSWLAADKTSGGRIPRFVGMLRRPQTWDVPEMIDTRVCRL